MLRFLTAGESHGLALVAIVEGLPAGLPVTEEEINRDLARRQGGYGRGGRMQIERDRVRFLSGLRRGKTLGSPLTLLIENRDWPHWREIMDPGPLPSAGLEAGAVAGEMTRPRPGHADLPGAIKYAHRDLRNVLERASARETAARVAVGAVARLLLRRLGIEVRSRVLAIGGARDETPLPPLEESAYWERVETSPLRCGDEEAAERMKSAIDEAARRGDTLGGVWEVAAFGVPPGLGSYVHWDRRLDGLLGQAVLSIPAIKGVEIGLGFRAAERFGSEVHDELLIRERNGYREWYRPTNRAGGLEGGVTNGEPVVIRAAMKPIPTLGQPLRSVDLRTFEPVEAARERSDVCAVPAASVVGEAVVAWVLAQAALEKCGGDNLEEVLRNWEGFLQAAQLWRRKMSEPT